MCANRSVQKLVYWASSNLLITQDGINQSTFPRIVTANYTDQNLLATLPELSFNIFGIWYIHKKIEVVISPFIQVHLNELHMCNTMLHEEMRVFCRVKSKSMLQHSIVCGGMKVKV